MTTNNTFQYRIVVPDDPDGRAIVLFHGTGGDESDLIPAAQLISPHAVIIGIRGRSTSEPSLRWFRRFPDGSFDQEEITSEARELSEFLPRLLSEHSIEPSSTTLLGFSNGANFIAAFCLLYPGLFRQGILWRPMLVLNPVPPADLTSSAFLITTGSSDPYADFVPALTTALEDAGADVQVNVLPTGHTLTRSDITLSADWLKERRGL